VNCHLFLLGSLLLTIVFTSTALAEVKLHTDLLGVTTKVGNVTINTRPGGRARASIPVGSKTFHTSNYGLSGISYATAGGRVHIFSKPQWSAPRAMYEPYHTPYVRKYFGRNWGDLGQVKPVTNFKRY
jgi:hypothetical protein